MIMKMESVRSVEFSTLSKVPCWPGQTFAVSRLPVTTTTTTESLVGQPCSLMHAGIASAVRASRLLWK